MVDIPQEELVPGSNGITPKELMERCSRLPEIPRIVPTTTDHYPILTTNEVLTRQKGGENDRTITDFDADGYLVGVGAGTIFSMLGVFPEGRSPKGIIAADVAPEVVLAGRVIVDLLKRHDTSQSFVDALGNLQLEDLDEAILREPSLEIRHQLQDRDEYALRGLRQIKKIDQTPLPAAMYSSDVKFFGRELSKNNVTNFINRFDQLKALAMEDKIAFVLQDITNPNFLREVTSLHDYQSSRNVIYLSNTVDHVIDGGRAPERFSVLETAQNTLQAREGNSLYVFGARLHPTNETRAGKRGPYNLQLSTTPPSQQQYQFLGPQT